MIEQFWLFHCAYARIPRSLIVDGGGWRLVRLPFLCGVARHATQGLVLFDAPYGHEGPANMGTLMGTFMRRTALVFREQWSVIPRLEEIGLRPAEVSQVCLTHLHYDHTGAMKTLAHCQFHVAQKEWDAAHEGTDRKALLKGYVRDDFSSLEGRMKFHSAPPLLADGGPGLDVLGDGSVEMFALPGHTEGHCGYRLHLVDGSTIFFAGDTTFTVPQLRGDQGFGLFPRSVAADMDQVLRSQAAMASHLRHHPAEIPIVCHDLELGRRTIDEGPVAFGPNT